MTTQNELAEKMKELAEQFAKLTDKQVANVIKEIGRFRGDIADLLSEFADNDGTINKSKLMRLLRELETIEKSMRQYGNDSILQTIDESIDFTLDQNNAIFLALLGLPLLASGKSAIKKAVRNYVITRIGDDGLQLSDRIWNVSGEIRDAIASQLRADIIRGESVSTMVRNIRKIYDNQTWMIQRLVVTENNTAHRMTTALSIDRSEIADWVRIRDNGSRHPRHTQHRCYILAHEDRYGQGQGVFKPTDEEIYSPHPNCSSYLVPVLKEEYL